MKSEMKFKIEQVALHPIDPFAAIHLLTEMGAGDWARDVVVATGVVHSQPGCTNIAQLNFEYEMLDNPASELEVLSYEAGNNWMQGQNRVSHLGMHCTESELAEWREFFAARGIPVAQEVNTVSHSNPVIAGKRKYNYVIFDTHEILSVDIKLIVRHDIPAV
jgi:hypothetical protein